VTRLALLTCLVVPLLAGCALTYYYCETPDGPVIVAGQASLMRVAEMTVPVCTAGPPPAAPVAPRLLADGADVTIGPEAPEDAAPPENAELAMVRADLATFGGLTVQHKAASEGFVGGLVEAAGWVATIWTATGGGIP
jgi:hypothetical protein